MRIKKPSEDKSIDIDQIPKSPIDSKKRETIGSDSGAKCDRSTSHTAYEKPSHPETRRSIRADTEEDDLDAIFSKYRNFDKFFQNDQEFNQASEFTKFGESANFEQFKDIDDSIDDNEPQGYVEKNIETNIKIINGKTTRKTVTTYKFADGSTKILHSPKIS